MIRVMMFSFLMVVIFSRQLRDLEQGELFDLCEQIQAIMPAEPFAPIANVLK